VVLDRIFTEPIRTLRAGIGLLAFCALAAGCAPKGVAPLVEPNRVESFCSVKPVHEYPKIDSMSSILTSVYDELPSPSSVPSLEQYKAGLKNGGGVISHYDRRSLLLLKPNLAKTLGESDDYVVATTVVFNNQVISDTSRFIYLRLRDHGIFRWQALRAADVQNVCSEGQRMM
jgi:hypothetical protein